MENTSSNISNEGDISYSHSDERDPLIPNVDLLDPTSINNGQEYVKSKYPTRDSY